MEQGIIYYGGSFNPLHIGHMRLAIETMANFRNKAVKLEFMPSYQPPHKDASSLLPFSLRCRMIDSSIVPYPAFSCCQLEEKLPQPSYTYNTLQAIHKLIHGREAYFLLGSQDFGLLHTWFQGLSLPCVCSLIVAPRGNYEEPDFLRQCRTYWPGGAIQKTQTDKFDHKTIVIYNKKGLRPIILETIPYINISSTWIRDQWLHDNNIDLLVPASIKDFLKNESALIRAIWQETEDKC